VSAKRTILALLSGALLIGGGVTLVGHRLGYPAYPSFLAFWDLDVLENGDEIFVEDSEGKEYTYRVFSNLVVNPSDLWVTQPVPGKNIVTLRTCTLPDYSQRLIVQAELVDEAYTRRWVIS
jgi:sortase A